MDPDQGSENLLANSPLVEHETACNCALVVCSEDICLIDDILIYGIRDPGGDIVR
jgi:hypothetical protein